MHKYFLYKIYHWRLKDFGWEGEQGVTARKALAQGVAGAWSPLPGSRGRAPGGAWGEVPENFQNFLLIYE